MEMQSLYSKLYSKYSRLKKEKDSELEKLNHDQEVKFLNYHQAAEAMIMYLKNENDRLETQTNELKNEVASIRSSKDDEIIQCQKLLMEERQKNRILLEEIESLKKLEQGGFYRHGSDDKTESEQLSTPGYSMAKHDASDNLASKMTKKRSRQSVHVAEDVLNPCDREEPEHAAEFQPATGLSKKTKIDGMSSKIHQPACCEKVLKGSGNGASTGLLNCIFQDLVECILGMNFSTAYQQGESCVSALHQSSGYCFSLTWINNSCGESELVYRVQSLGTFERVAPEWMREVLIFSSSMCPVFFERVSRIIKLSH